MKYYLKIVLQHYAMGIIIPVAIVWKLQSGLTISEALLTESVVLLVTAICDLPAGIITTKLNNKRALAIGAFFHFIALLLLAIGGSFTIFLISAVFMGLAWAFISGADEAYIHDDFIEDKSEYRKVFARSTIADEATTIAGMLSASALLHLGCNIQTLLVIASFVLLLHLAYTLVYLPKSQPLRVFHPSKNIRLINRKLLTNREFRTTAFIMVAFALIYEGLRPLWQPHLQELSIGIASFGLIFAVLKLASLAGSVLASQRDFSGQDMSYVFVVMAVTLLLFGINVQVISLIGLSVYLFTENYFRIYMSTIMNKLIKHNRAAMLSIGSVVRNATGALIIAGAGIVSSQSIMLALCLVVALKIPAMVYVLRIHKHLVNKAT